MANISLVRDCTAANSVFVTAQRGTDGSCIGLVNAKKYIALFRSNFKLADILPGNTQLLELFPLDVPSCGFNGELCDQRGFE